MLTRLTGAALLLTGCTALGLGQSRKLRGRVHILRQLLSKLERLTTEVCCLCTPLPEVLMMLCGRAVEPGEIRECSFMNIWRREIARLELPPPETGVLLDLGQALSRGDRPERAFQAAEERLRSLLREAESEAERKSRLCSSLGICAGVLLVIVLI